VSDLFHLNLKIKKDSDIKLNHLNLEINKCRVLRNTNIIEI